MMVIGQKVGMTRIFETDGKAVAVSMVKVEPNVVISIKDLGQGNKKVQIAGIKAEKLNKPESGHIKKATENKYLVLKEFETSLDLKTGDKIDVSAFKSDDKVTIIGTSKGKGFSGVIKRHNFSRGPKTHGSDHHRKPGSIGSMFPQHVLKGQKMPGHMGSERVTVKNLKIKEVDADSMLMLVSGAVPGSRGSVVLVSKE